MPNGKKNKASVDYSKSTGRDRCGNCVHYEAGKRLCELVQGRIEADMWCKLYKRRK